jgi:hypothetical protein
MKKARTNFFLNATRSVAIGSSVMRNLTISNVVNYVTWNSRYLRTVYLARDIRCRAMNSLCQTNATFTNVAAGKSTIVR